jgi:hypothetical protein
MCGMSLLNERQGHRIIVNTRLGRRSAEGAMMGPDMARASEIERVGDPFGAPKVPRARTTKSSRPASPEPTDSVALPPGLAMAWGQIPRDGPSTVLFDSWDSFYADYLDWVPARARGATPTEGTERRLLRRLLRPGMLFIGVIDQEAPSPLEYEADAVLVTRLDSGQEQPERWLSITKLRQVEIRQSEYPFTLWGGRFQCVPPVPADFSMPPAALEPEPPPVPGSIWPGSSDFARTFGRLPLGGISLIETDPDVPVIMWGLVALSFAAEIFRLGGRFCFVPPPTLLQTRTWVEGLQNFPPQMLVRQFRVLAPVSDTAYPIELRPIFLPLRDSEHGGFSASLAEGNAQGVAPNSTQPRFPATTRFVSEHPTKVPNGILVSIDGLVNCARQVGSDYTPESLPTIIQSEVKDQLNHVMVVGRVDDPLSRSLHSSAVLHLRILSRKGRYFIHGVRPTGPNHVITPASSEEGAHGLYSLIPVV